MKGISRSAVLILSVGLGGLTACEKRGGPLRVDYAEPAEGTTAGGDQIVIKGGGFEPGKTQAQVAFGRRRAENVVISSPTTIAVVTPPGEKGPVDVSVMFDSGEAFKIPGGFKFVPPAGASDVRKAFFDQQKKE